MSTELVAPPNQSSSLIPFHFLNMSSNTVSTSSVSTTPSHAPSPAHPLVSLEAELCRLNGHNHRLPLDGQKETEPAIEEGGSLKTEGGDDRGVLSTKWRTKAGSVGERNEADVTSAVCRRTLQNQDTFYAPPKCSSQDGQGKMVGGHKGREEGGEEEHKKQI